MNKEIYTQIENKLIILELSNKKIDDKLNLITSELSENEK